MNAITEHVERFKAAWEANVALLGGTRASELGQLYLKARECWSWLHWWHLHRLGTFDWEQ